MNILVIYDDTERAHACLTRFTPDYDFELLECDISSNDESVIKFLSSKTIYGQIIIGGESVDKRNMTKNKFVPYTALKMIKDTVVDISTTKITLVSPDHDFLNKGKYIADGLNLTVETHHIPD